jgi:hypothetical protein
MVNGMVNGSVERAVVDENIEMEFTCSVLMVKT